MGNKQSNVIKKKKKAEGDGSGSTLVRPLRMGILELRPERKEGASHKQIWERSFPG